MSTTKMSRANSASLRAGSGSDALYAGVVEAIQSGQLKYQERLAPLRELASRYSIAFTTAQAAVGRLEEAGFVTCRRGSGTYVTWQPKRPAIPAPTETVYLILDNKGHVYKDLVATLVTNLQHARMVPVQVSYNPSRPGEGIEHLRGILESWKHQPPRAVVIQQWRVLQAELRDALLALQHNGTRLILTFCPDAVLPSNLHLVSVDRLQAYRWAAERLVNLGHRRIGFVTHCREHVDEKGDLQHKIDCEHTSTILTLGRLLRQASPRDALTIHYNHPNNPLDEQAIALAAQWLSAPRRPTAVIGDDNRMLGIKRAAERIGLRVPEDLMLVGMGNTPWAEGGGITSFCVREELIAKNISHLITLPDELINDTAYHIMVRPQWVYRTSCPAPS